MSLFSIYIYIYTHFVNETCTPDYNKNIIPDYIRNTIVYIVFITVQNKRKIKKLSVLRPDLNSL